jgi:hypothetical protein
MNWNEMTQEQRHDWLRAAGVHNLTFKFLDWDDLPEALKNDLGKVVPPHVGGCKAE